MRKAVLLSVAFLTFGSLAHASLIPTLGSITASGNPTDPFLWNYSVALSGDEQLNPADTSSAATPGTFFTLYDVSSTAPVLVGAPVGWTGSEQLVGTTPSGISPTDNSSLWNVTYTYSGPVVAPGTLTNFSGFTMDFATSAMALGQFAYQATELNTTITNGTTDNGKGFSIVPAVATPEPTSFWWLGLGIVSVAWTRRKFARN